LRAFLYKILSFIIGFFLIAVCIEVFLKLSEIKLPFKTLDPEIGKTYQSNTYINETKEGFYMGKTNEYGFIGNVNKKENTFRIALFGDSFTEGFQVFEPYKFSRVLEKSINKKLKVKVEILNFGISNVVLPEIYIRKKRLAEKFDIDLFIYVFDSYDFVFQPEGILNSVELIEKDSVLSIIPNTSKSYQLYQKVKPIIDNSSYLNFAFDGYLLVRRGQAFPKLFDKFYSGNTINYFIGIPDNPFESLTPKYLKIISEMAKDNTIFIFRENADGKLKSTIEPYNIPIIETEEVLNNLRQNGVNPYYWESTQTIGHFNYEANNAFGNYLSDKLAPFIKKK
jgi:hypothetical protein